MEIFWTIYWIPVDTCVQDLDEIHYMSVSKPGIEPKTIDMDTNRINLYLQITIGVLYNYLLRHVCSVWLYTCLHVQNSVLFGQMGSQYLFIEATARRLMLQYLKFRFRTLTVHNRGVKSDSFMKLFPLSELWSQIRQTRAELGVVAQTQQRRGGPAADHHLHLQIFL